MAAILLKYTVMTLCAMYIFKFTIRAPGKKRTVFYMLLSLPVGFGYYLLRSVSGELIYLTYFALFTVVNMLVFRLRAGKAVVRSAVSMGLSYATFVISSILMAPVALLIAQALGLEQIQKGVEFLSLASGGQILITLLIFRSKRVRSGFCSLTREDNILGVFISVVLLAAISLLDEKVNNDVILTIIIIFVELCALTLIFWRNDRITKRYVARASERHIEMLEASLRSKDEEIARLAEDNGALASVIHRDNKLLPAMRMAVENGSGDREQLAKSIGEMMEDRQSALEQCERRVSEITPSGWVSVDAALLYMEKLASERGVKLETAHDAQVLGAVIPQMIGEHELNTIIADLLENAIISAQSSEQKLVRFEASEHDGEYRIGVYDTGAQFEPNVLQTVGFRRITTRAKEGGSGIGLMSAFELAGRHDAGILIEELPEGKRVSVVFGTQIPFAVITHRAAELARAVTRPDAVLISA